MVGLDGGHDFREAHRVLAHLHVALLVLVILPGLGGGLVLRPRGVVELEVARRDLGIPLVRLPLGFKGFIGLREPVLIILGAPRAIDGVGDGIAQPGVDIVGGCPRKQTEGIVNMLGRGITRGQVIENRHDNLLVGSILGRGLLRGVEIFFKPGLEKPVIGGMPAFAVPSENLRAGVEDGDIASEEGAFLLRASRRVLAAATPATASSRGRGCRRLLGRGPG